MTSARNIVVAFRSQRARASTGRTRVPAGGARDRRDAALADRPRHRRRPSSLCSALALAWACLGTVDIVATAPGKIIPSGRTKVIQPFETGVVRAIHVRDGQTRQGRRRPDRARSDHERCRARASEERSDRGSARRRAAARGAGRNGRSARRVQAAARCASPT